MRQIKKKHEKELYLLVGISLCSFLLITGTIKNGSTQVHSRTHTYRHAHVCFTQLKIIFNIQRFCNGKFRDQIIVVNLKGENY